MSLVATALAALPELLRERVAANWADWQQNIAEDQLSEAIAASLPAVWAGSDFVMKTCLRQPHWLTDGLPEKQHVDHQALFDLLAAAADEAELQRELRHYRNQHMLRIIWRDLAGWASLTETLNDLSVLAEACIDAALMRLYDWQCEEVGTPRDAQGEALGLVVLGMGKLGARELNLSSDIDLVFAYREEGVVEKAGKTLTHAQFFTRLGQRLIQALDRLTAEGFVFRVDMRLRPFGKSGALAASFSAIENYYLIHGREWERYAMIKARPVAGERQAGIQLMAMLKPFVYRRYLDFGAYESLREMKTMLMREVRRKGLAQNIKLGAGGIREVEFIAQVFQLIRGGREPALQTPSLFTVFAHLREQAYLLTATVDELLQAYTFLRLSENRLQAWADQQIHILPSEPDAQLRLAFSMGYCDWDSYSVDLEQHRRHVQTHFAQVFDAPQAQDHSDSLQARLDGIWRDGFDDRVQASRILTEAGFEDTEDVLRQLLTLRSGHRYVSLPARSRQRFDRLMPLLLGASGQTERPDVTLMRLLDLLQQIARRSVYMALLVEYPLALSQLVKLCSASPWIARYLSQQPLLLDELLDPRSLYAPPDRAALQAELHQRMASCEAGDLELAMDTLRHFHHSNVLRVAAADQAGVLPLMKVSDHLSWIAEVVLEEALELAWQDLVERHGRPVCDLAGQACDKGFGVIAYGKLGGLELGYGSDLDLVFLHAGENADMMTDGEQPQLLPVFFARLGQRLIHILSAHTSAGMLYEIDMRLRPNGASGMLVSSLDAYAGYQRDKAWVWEHQALVRARFVAGDEHIGERFAEIRRQVLCQPREQQSLRDEVCSMRRRMRKELLQNVAGRFDLKQSVGGLVDIEFMVQFAVLAWAQTHPALTTFTDTIRLLEGLAQSGLMRVGDVAILSDAYQQYRGRLHRLALQEQGRMVADSEFTELREAVSRIWLEWMEKTK
ncbi:Glutamate-ammonia-ligase adenylyltransferase [hydrothermal vent metagenome]|uniref:Glutamate-ammonia-ligase adenylyltransferase n=1 Tax=hydrothermal vent metagenome TaxID=652676 RepID=A0A3B1BJD3_9ZZZZ